MKWEERIAGAEILRPWLDDESATDFRSLMKALIEEQKASWPGLREAVAGLAAVEYRKLSVNGSEVVAQFNPMRAVSTTARVDASAINSRPCFLCAENLPPEERGLEYGDDLVVLCNPFPILPRHLVISSRQHISQSISGEGHVGVLLDLARDLGEEYFTIYNGPACGASAPDHLHFQACERRWLPVFADVERWERQALIKNSRIEVFTLKDYRVNALIARSVVREELVEWFGRTERSLAEVTASSAEPMLNMVATVDGDRWTAIVYPRGKHRPSCFYAEAESKLTVSPGALDLSGVLVVPRADHFAKITEEDVRKIYSEVTLDDERFDQLIAGIGKRENTEQTE